MAGNISIESFATKTRGWYRANYSHFHRNKNWNLFVHSIFFSGTEFSFHLLSYLSILRKDRVNSLKFLVTAEQIVCSRVRFQRSKFDEIFFFLKNYLWQQIRWTETFILLKKNIQYQTHLLFNYTRKLFMRLESQADFLKEVTFFSQVTEARIRNISSSERNGGQLLGKAKLRPV